MKAKLNIKTLISNADSIWHKIRWSKTGKPICTCGCDKLYTTGKGLYKCKSCGKIFSDRSGTLMHHSKLPTWIWLVSMYKFSSCTECSAIDLQKECGINYKTAYLILQKLRFASGKDKVVLEGMISIDELYIGGWSNMHFGKKIEWMINNGYMKKGDRYTKTEILRASSAKKFHTISLIDVNNKTRLIHCPNPITKEIIKSVLKTTQVTAIVSDESKLYKGQGVPVYQSNHSKHIYVSPEGYSSNVCENRFSWVTRKWNGTYSHTSEKYLQLYLWQRQWHYNHIDLTTEESFYKFAKLCSEHIITYKNISNYNYKSKFPKGRREVEEEQAKEILKSCGLISSVTDHYGRVYK